MSLTRLLEPEQIALVGASSRRESISGQFLKHLLGFGFSGKVYPVNPRAQSIEGLPCYGSVAEIPQKVDLAVVLVSKDLVCGILEQCVGKQIPYAVIPAAGFAEAGEEGRELQERITEIARSGGMRIVGPNCMGFINFKKKIVVSFGAFLEGVTVRSGNIGLVVHSGAFGGQTVVRCLKRGVGFTYSISSGNEADLHALDFIEFLIEDQDTQVIAAFLESVRDAAKLVELGRKARGAGKVLVVLKGGRSARAREAVASHTGRMAGSHRIYEGVFKQGRIVETTNPEEFWDALEVFSKVSATPRALKIGAVVASGGAGVLACDGCEALGLEMASLSESTRARLARFIPDAGSVMNPVDVTAQIPHNEPEKLPRIIEILCQEPAVTVLLLSIADKHFQLCWRAILPLVQKYQKLLLCVNSALPAEVLSALDASGSVAVGDNVWRSLKKLELLKRNGDGEKVVGDDDNNLVEPTRLFQIPNPGRPLSEADAKALLKPLIPVPSGGLALTVEDAVGIAERVGYPVVLKLTGPGLRHKSDVRGVRTDIRRVDELRAQFEALSENARASGIKIDGILIEEMIAGGMELAVGFVRDANFGPVALLGLGGVFVELLQRVSFRLLPLRRSDALAMLEELAIVQLLSGFRNQPARDVNALLDAFLGLSRVFLANAWIQEMEVNPMTVLVKGKGVRALDLLVSARDPSPDGTP